MGTYNKVMIYIWWIIAVSSAIGVTIMGIRFGFDRWYQYYFFSILALLMVFMKRLMMKRMQKHIDELENKNK